MCRGDRRDDIFRDDGDREMLLATLAEAVEKTRWQVHAWVWMSNHYHLLVETPEANLVKEMTWFQTTYTTRFNARHRLRRHLFGGRYSRAERDRQHGHAARRGLVEDQRGHRGRRRASLFPHSS